ncbi:MAG TPA: 50S ribosomal protein L17 [Candidatus Marinimicrobia bacterium]|nr:50S ribosomal protein L17 [Candidatus Neomarinimicrobiota bacterium]
MVIHKKIRTTDAKGKELRSYIERLVTYAKRGDVHGRRLIQKRITGKRGKEIANILIHEIAPAYADRQGGYTRLIKLNNRKNDNAPVSLIEFIDIAPDVTEISDNEVVEEKKGDTKE